MLVLSMAAGAPTRAAAGVVLAGTRHPLARPELDRGPVDGATIVRGMSLVLARSREQQNALDALPVRQRDHSSADYRQWLTPE